MGSCEPQWCLPYSFSFSNLVAVSCLTCEASRWMTNELLEADARVELGGG